MNENYEAYAEYEDYGGPEGLDDWEKEEEATWAAQCEAMAQAEANYYENSGWAEAMAYEQYEARLGSDCTYSTTRRTI